MNRFSSRRQPLNESFLNERLRRAVSYDRIAGYFRSSVFEIAGEAFNDIPGKVRIICNSGLDEHDVRTAQGQKREFYLGDPIQAATINPQTSTTTRGRCRASRGDSSEPATKASAHGTVASPACNGDNPSTSCRYCVMKM